ncbi:AsnC family transcriptional regulator [Kitasatospora herbaricolor]|uniref:Lrp/AsnC family transcriptional regulator n=1 Tax=Kitasatospora herbaricolor TaxID=68217 RepID=UPI00174A0372|nr:Lrp/AsnC family transcriptional regulator [Kitasatospora herbaricolor]MDQ0307040.1 DNA-binding Lrp family transcriptional regulator [Kitasatospora herbaricolor]GGV18561.1 AsnC family transcriptional regulator [Kitasatospora herbaricolor]
MKLDAFDAALVRELQQDGRVSYQRLAESLGVSREAARARVHRLLESGTVRVVGIVRPWVVGIGAVAHVSLDVEGPGRPAAEVAAARPASSFVSCTAGARAVVAELRVADEAALEREFAVLRSAPGVRGIEVFRCTRLVRDAYSPATHPAAAPEPAADVPQAPAPSFPAAPAVERPPAVDEVDRTLLGLLQADGRASFAALAERVGLSQPATRARVLRLLQSGAVHVTGLVDSRAVGVREAVGVGLTVRGGAAAAAAAAARLPGINYVAAGYGRFDVVCGVDATDRPALLATLDSLRASAGVVRLESWYHLEIVKESYAYDLPV